MLRTRMFSEMPGKPGPQAADAAHDQVDRHAGLAGPIQRFDHAMVHQRVDLGEDSRLPPVACSLGLLVDQLDRAAVQVVGGDDELAPACPCE